MITLSKITNFSLLLSLTLCTAWGQAPTFGTFKSDRGFFPYGSYSLSDTESIDEASGNLSLRIPLAALPPGRGGIKLRIDLLYNSQLFDLGSKPSGTEGVPECTGQSQVNCPPYVNGLIRPEESGWRYSYNYRVVVENRPSPNYCQGSDLANFRTVKMQIVLPDGSSHLLRLRGQTDNYGDGYYNYNPDGTAVCSAAALSFPLQYYTTDGTFIQVSREATPNATAGVQRYRAVFSDGRQIYWDNAQASFDQANRVCDRNNNCVQIVNAVDVSNPANPVPYTELNDDFSRKVRIRYMGGGTPCLQNLQPCSTSTSDEIQQAAYGQNPGSLDTSTLITWRVSWANTTIGTEGNRAPYTCFNPDQTREYQCRIFTSVRNVFRVDLPVTNLSYNFSYADPATAVKGWGELRVMLLPISYQSAQVTYTYKYATESGGRTATFHARNPVATKSVQRYEPFNGSTILLPAENWSFTFPDGGVPTGTVTNPDGGVKSNFFYPENASTSSSNLLWKTQSPEGTITETWWDINEPWIGFAAPGDRKNSYARAQFHKRAGSTQYSATSYQYDKNGTLLAQQDHAFLTNISRHASGWPNGAPSSAVLRTTSHQMANPTQIAEGNLPATLGATDVNAYWMNFGLLTKGSRQKTQLFLGLAAGTLERYTEFSYDNSATTANLTSERHWDNTDNAALPTVLARGNNNAAVTDYTWFQGNLLTQTDPVSSVTSLTYNIVPSCPTNGPVPFWALYPTRITQFQGSTLPVFTDYLFDCALGVLQKSTQYLSTSQSALTNARRIESQGGYDAYGRLTSLQENTGPTLVNWRQSITQYDDYARTVRVASSRATFGDLRQSAVSYFDTMGKLTSTRSVFDTGGAVSPGSSHGIVTEQAARYFTGGRYEITRSPYNQSPEPGVDQPPAAWTRKTYDRDGRLTEVATYPALPAPWGSNTAHLGRTTYVYAGENTTETDPAQKVRVETSDDLGRLLSVNQGNGLSVASYQYNAADQLVQVLQTDAGTYQEAKTQTRAFTYDSRGRLRSASNPESGLTQYKYNFDGTLRQRSDARNISINYEYDARKRISTKNHSDVTYTYVRYCYDGQERYNDPGGPFCTPVTRPVDDFAFGRLTGFGDVDNWTNYKKIDGLGRTVTVEQNIASLSAKTIQYAYDADGAVNSMTLPSGRVVSYTLSDNGRPTALSGSLAGLSKSYVTDVKYAPQGAVAAWNLNAGGVQEKRQYNGLFQLTDSVATRVSDNQRLLRLVLAYGAGDNNGNLLTQYIETGQLAVAQEYRYDALNRLRIAAEGPGLNTTGLLQNGTCSQVAVPTWCVRYDYDRFGNAWSPERTGSVAAGLLATSRSWYAPENVTGQPANVTNKMPAANYDAAGNQTRLEVNNPNRLAVYDAEGRIKRIDDNLSVLANYYYDAEGHRVRRVTGGASYWYVYGLDGQVVAEYQTGGILPSGTDFLLTDHLGSTRAKFNSQNQVTGRYDYEPFGGELVRTGVAGYGPVDPFTQRFTGKERDPETINSNNASGLDFFGARYFGASLGRFTSPDAPFADQHPENPQSWNLYSYVRNNPLAYVDTDGRGALKVAKLLVKGAKAAYEGGSFAAGVVDDLGRVGKALGKGATLGDYLDAGKAAASYLPVVGDVIDAVDLASDAVEAGTNVYSTYTKTNPDTGEVYTGRTSGTGTPAENVANRDRGHRGKEGFGPAVIDVSSTNKDAIRGREEQKIEQHGKAQKRGGTSGNKIGGISPKNPKRQAYLEAAREIFGELLKK